MPFIFTPCVAIYDFNSHLAFRFDRMRVENILIRVRAQLTRFDHRVPIPIVGRVRWELYCNQIHILYR